MAAMSTTLETPAVIHARRLRDASGAAPGCSSPSRTAAAQTLAAPTIKNSSSPKRITPSPAGMVLTVLEVLGTGTGNIPSPRDPFAVTRTLYDPDPMNQTCPVNNWGSLCDCFNVS